MVVYFTHECLQINLGYSVGNCVSYILWVVTVGVVENIANGIWSQMLSSEFEYTIAYLLVYFDFDELELDLHWD